MDDLELYIHPTYFIDSDHPDIIRLAKSLTTSCTSDIEKAVVLFYYVRDGYRYNPYNVRLRHELLKASHVLNRSPEPFGFCIEKAVLFAALCRVLKIPNRLVFCNVKNHLAPEGIEQMLGTDLVVFHGYNEVWLEDKWVKCTVAFNKSLCDKLGVNTLEFDGRKDQIFQEFDKEGGLFMEYVHDYGSFHDVPYDMWMSETRKYYPHLFEMKDGEEHLLRVEETAVE